MAEVVPPGSGAVTEVMHDLYDSDGTLIGYKVELRATPSAGYRFDYFTWTQHSYWDGDFFPPSTVETSSDQNPELNGPRKIDQLTRYGVYYHQEYYSVKAHFSWVGSGPEPGTKFTVTISASPQNGGVVTGGGEFDSGTICTLSAERNIGYELMRLVSDDGITIYPQNPPQCFGKTITHSFEVTKDSSWIAYFRACTNAILRGKSGNILRGQGGNILRDW